MIKVSRVPNLPPEKLSIDTMSSPNGNVPKVVFEMMAKLRREERSKQRSNTQGQLPHTNQGAAAQPTQNNTEPNRNGPTNTTTKVPSNNYQELANLRVNLPPDPQYPDPPMQTLYSSMQQSSMQQSRTQHATPVQPAFNTQIHSSNMQPSMKMHQVQPAMKTQQPYAHASPKQQQRKMHSSHNMLQPMHSSSDLQQVTKRNSSPNLHQAPYSHPNLQQAPPMHYSSNMQHSPNLQQATQMHSSPNMNQMANIQQPSIVHMQVKPPGFDLPHGKPSYDLLQYPHTSNQSSSLPSFDTLHAYSQPMYQADPMLSYRDHLPPPCYHPCHTHMCMGCPNPAPPPYTQTQMSLSTQRSLPGRKDV